MFAKLSYTTPTQLKMKFKPCLEVCHTNTLKNTFGAS